MGRWDKMVKLFVYMSGGVIAITVFCIVIGILLEEIWGINTLYSFYVVVARMVLASMILGIPCCIGGVYIIAKSRRLSLGGKG